MIESPSFLPEVLRLGLLKQLISQFPEGFKTNYMGEVKALGDVVALGYYAGEPSLDTNTWLDEGGLLTVDQSIHFDFFLDETNLYESPLSEVAESLIREIKSRHPVIKSMASSVLDVKVNGNKVTGCFVYGVAS